MEYFKKRKLYTVSINESMSVVSFICEGKLSEHIEHKCKNTVKNIKNKTFVK